MAEMVVIDGVRHMAMVEAPATVNLLIGAFLARAELGG
jgi:pimeloyl-ACP methyl ester carboxylesterase